MRLWSLHPKYLDAKGLIAVWREGLLAQKVLMGKTQGYKNHPQLIRFRNCLHPTEAINAFLFYIWLEAQDRGYCFNKRKIKRRASASTIFLSEGQLYYEFSHLLIKLKKRDEFLFKKLQPMRPKEIEINPIFSLVPGKIETWEKIKKGNPPVGKN